LWFNCYHSSIKITPIQASKKENKGIVYFTETLNKKAKFEMSDTVRISKYKPKVFD